MFDAYCRLNLTPFKQHKISSIDGGESVHLFHNNFRHPIDHKIKKFQD